MYSDMPIQDIFTYVYEHNIWGGSDKDFFSGPGSRDADIVGPYVSAVRSYLNGLERPLNLVDLGCGDFVVGRQLVEMADSYTACDIVRPLIARNEQIFKRANLAFQALNAVEDPLPPGNVVFIRQVLQHLSNADIQRILPKLARYKVWIITEILPAGETFVPNRDKPTGPDIRWWSNSGIVLTAPPFGVSPRAQEILCEVPESGGSLRTIAYRF